MGAGQACVPCETQGVCCNHLKKINSTDKDVLLEVQEAEESLDDRILSDNILKDVTTPERVLPNVDYPLKVQQDPSSGQGSRHGVDAVPTQNGSCVESGRPSGNVPTPSDKNSHMSGDELAVTSKGAAADSLSTTSAEVSTPPSGVRSVSDKDTLESLKLVEEPQKNIEESKRGTCVDGEERSSARRKSRFTRRVGQSISKRISRSAAVINSTNPNIPSDYGWLEPTFRSLVGNQLEVGYCSDTANGKKYAPLFFIIGACPNLLCGMQAVMFCATENKVVDFWWVKPMKDRDGCFASLEKNTMFRHNKGPYKNDPGRAKPFLKPFADLFEQGLTKGKYHFGVEQIITTTKQKCLRAFIDLDSNGKKERMYMYLVWQEDWASALAWTKYVKGKFIYQKDHGKGQFFSRQFYLTTSGVMTISELEEGACESTLPANDIKILRD